MSERFGPMVKIDYQVTIGGNPVQVNLTENNMKIKQITEGHWNKPPSGWGLSQVDLDQAQARKDLALPDSPHAKGTLEGEPLKAGDIIGIRPHMAKMPPAKVQVVNLIRDGHSITIKHLGQRHQHTTTVDTRKMEIQNPYREINKKSMQGVAEATGDPKFDKMLKGITAKKSVAKQQKADAKQQAQAAFGGMFGGGNPADQLGAKKKDVEEAHALDNNSVIYRLDKERPMSDTEVLMLGGAGRYTLNGLRNKARKEARALATDLEVEHGGSFRDAAENIKQLTNTLNTIVAAYNELRRIRQKGGRGSRGITDEHATFVRECLTMLENYTTIVNRASRIVESIQFKLTETMKQGKMNSDQASTIKGMFHLNTDPGYGFYRWAIHVAGNHGGDKVVLGPNGGPFAYAYTAEEEKMIRDAVRAITGKDPIELTGGKSEEPDFVNTKSTMPTIDWKKVK